MQWSTTDARIGAVLLRTSEAYARFRELMRYAHYSNSTCSFQCDAFSGHHVDVFCLYRHDSEMGTSAGVPIEPPEQTAILDATLAIPGVLLAGVPGGRVTPSIVLVCGD